MEKHKQMIGCEPPTMQVITVWAMNTRRWQKEKKQEEEEMMKINSPKSLLYLSKISDRTRQSSKPCKHQTIQRKSRKKYNHNVNLANMFLSQAIS